MPLFVFNSKIRGAAAVFLFEHHQDLVAVLDAVGVKRPEAALQLLGSEHGAHLFVDVEEADAVGGQLQQSLQLLLQVAHRLLQAEGDRLHPVPPADLHHGAARAQVHFGERGQVAVFGHKGVVPGTE